MNFQNHWHVRVVVGLCVGLLWSSCKKDGGSASGDLGEAADRPARVEKNRSAAGSLEAPPMFANIPADTAYVFAAFDAFPTEYWSKMMKDVGPVFDELLDQVIASASEDIGSDMANAVLGEFRGKFNAEGIESLGFSTTPRFAIYGVGWFPVLRLELADGGKLRALVARIESKLGTQIPTRTQDGVSYFFAEEGDTAIAVAILDKELVAGFSTPQAMPALLPYVLGTKKPAQSMADGGPLKKLASDYGFTGYGLGYIDLVRVGKLLAIEFGSEMPAGCAAELETTLEKFPRAVVGYDEISAKNMSMTAMFEMAPDIAKKLAAVRSNVPGVTTKFDQTPLIAIGGGFDLAAAKSFGQFISGELSRLGSKCKLPELGEAGSELAGELDKPIPPEVSGVHGGAVVVLDAEMTMSGIPTGIEGYAIIGTRDPKELVKMVNSIGAEMGLELKTDGKFHRQNIPVPFVPELHAAVKKNAIAIAGGPKGLAAVQKALEQDSQSPLFFVAYDYGRLMSMAGDSLDMLAQAEAPAIRNMTMAQAKMFGLLAMWLYASDRGLGLRVRIDMK